MGNRLLHKNTICSALPQRFRQRPFTISPGFYCVEAARGRVITKLAFGKFVRRFCPDRFTGVKMELSDVPNTNLLTAKRQQMHLNSPLRLIPADLMRKRAQIEVGVQFPVNAAQEIQVECRRDTHRIVIGRNHRVD
jgi:hypothetical protein